MFSYVHKLEISVSKIHLKKPKHNEISHSIMNSNK